MCIATSSLSAALERWGAGVETHFQENGSRPQPPTPFEGVYVHRHIFFIRSAGEVGGWGRDPFSRNFMKPTPRRKWYILLGLDPSPPPLQRCGYRRCGERRRGYAALKSYVSFAECRLFYRALLQKRRIILRSLLNGNPRREETRIRRISIE